ARSGGTGGARIDRRLRPGAPRRTRRPGAREPDPVRGAGSAARADARRPGGTREGQERIRAGGHERRPRRRDSDAAPSEAGGAAPGADVADVARDGGGRGDRPRPPDLRRRRRERGAAPSPDRQTGEEEGTAAPRSEDRGFRSGAEAGASAGTSETRAVAQAGGPEAGARSADAGSEAGTACAETRTRRAQARAEDDRRRGRLARSRGRRRRRLARRSEETRAVRRPHPGRRRS